MDPERGHSCIPPTLTHLTCCTHLCALLSANQLEWKWGQGAKHLTPLHGFNGAWPSQHLLTSCWRKEKNEVSRESRLRKAHENQSGREIKNIGWRGERERRRLCEKKKNWREKRGKVIYGVLWLFQSFFIFSLLPLRASRLTFKGLGRDTERSWQKFRSTQVQTGGKYQLESCLFLVSLHPLAISFFRNGRIYVSIRF